MVEKLKSSLISVSKGVIVPIITIFSFSLVLVLFLSLTLLVISIEECTGNLSDSAMSITWGVLLFAQGVGLTFGNCVLTIIPLGLTILIVTTLVCLIRHIKGGPLAYVAGLIVWVFASIILSQNTSVALLDSQIIVACKTAFVYLLSLIIAVVPQSSFFAALKKSYQKICPEWIRKNITILKRAAIILLALYATVAVITVIVWSCISIGSVDSFFIKLGMKNGSRILTTIACLIWLPNIAIWALSWICGSGFSIGKVAYFTMVDAQYKSLPPVPVFGIFPEAVKDVLYRTVFYGIIPTVCFITMLVVILHKRGCCLRLKNIKDKSELRAFALRAIESGSLSVGVAAVITIICTIVFAMSNGSLGEYRLASVGVDVIDSTRAVGHFTLYAVASAWALSVLSVLIAAVVPYVFGLIRNGRNYAKNSSKVENQTKAEPKPQVESKPQAESESKPQIEKPQVEKTQVEKTQVESKPQAEPKTQAKDANHESATVKALYAINSGSKVFGSVAKRVLNNSVQIINKTKSYVNKNATETKVPRTASSRATQSSITSSNSSKKDTSKQKSPLSLKKAAPRTVSSKTKRK